MNTDSFDNILEIDNLSKVFSIKDENSFFHLRKLSALDSINLNVRRGEVLGLVGESGCGKSTLARCIIGLVKNYSGNINFKKKTNLNAKHPIQLIFQDPVGSLNPRLTIEESISESLRYTNPEFNRQQRSDKAYKLLTLVGLTAEYAKFYPHILSGGQAQRVAIARALINNPELLLCDEPVSALDVSIRAQIINLLLSLQKKLNLSMVFISHDLSIVYQISNRVAVMYLGRLVELIPSDGLFENVKHPYSHALLSAVPSLKNIYKNNISSKNKHGNSQVIKLEGEPPSPFNIPSGCPFRTRCLHVRKKCHDVKPIMRIVDTDHFVSCHYWESINNNL